MLDITALNVEISNNNYINAVSFHTKIEWGDIMTFEDFCAYHNIVVVNHNFSGKIRGLCIKEGDCYIVAINPKFCSGSQNIEV